MYLRGPILRYSNNSIRRRLNPLASLTPGTSSSAAPHAINSGRLNSTIRECNGSHHGSSTPSSIRPFTVLILCVPFGFALSWALKDENNGQAPTSPDGFVRYRIKGKEPVSSTSSIFNLEPVTSSTIQTDVPGLQGAITSVQIKQPQLQIARNYTFLPPAEAKEVKFLIRKERNGEVSGYLHKLPVGSDIELRGPVVDYVLRPDVHSVVVLAGGTGIVPALQVGEALAGKVHVHILWANRRREDCVGGRSDTLQPLGWTANLRRWFMVDDKDQSDAGNGAHPSQKGRIVLDLERLKHLSMRQASSRDALLKTDYFVDEENTFISANHLQRLLRGDNSIANDGSIGRRLLLVSGPDGFIEHWAGAKQWVGGREVQGPLGGVLSTLNTNGWDVVKL